MHVNSYCCCCPALLICQHEGPLLPPVAKAQRRRTPLGLDQVMCTCDERRRRTTHLSKVPPGRRISRCDMHPHCTSQSHVTNAPFRAIPVGGPSVPLQRHMRPLNREVAGCVTWLPTSQELLPGPVAPRIRDARLRSAVSHRSSFDFSPRTQRRGARTHLHAGTEPF
jgi:hypothetical protein